MKTLISRSLETTVKKVNLILMFMGGLISASMLSSMIAYEDGSYQRVMGICINAQHLLVFFLITGIYLIIVTSVGTGNIAGENADGTLKLLVAKPNSRVQILLAKLIGTVGGEMILYGIGLTAYYSFSGIFGKADGSVFRLMLGYLPGYLLFGLAITLAVNSLATLLSCLFNKKIGAMLLVLAVVILTLGFFPIQRLVMMLNSSEGNWFIDLVDTNYHMATLFRECVRPFGGVINSPATVDIIMYLMKLFKVSAVDNDISAGEIIVDEYHFLAPALVIGFYAVLSAINYLLSFMIFRKKDI